ncbi:tyrosine-protein phosphatase non-receptor type 22 [Protopterus annectens]|uniref:tyrosine-protein phosphatase non-receptor type 22 n=1 Tax=Protopterus annectens TaxID=7888 RepID=UPI001CFA178C|nr:tyrosine-protein phosphatase non-receptor type 22 [Protopterus annectens]
MIWEYDILIIVMACREIEMGRKKCEKYWSNLGEEPFCTDCFSVSCESEDNKGEYILRTLKVSFYKDTRTLYQFHYMNWPDHDVPEAIDPILEMIWEVRSLQDNESAPLCIHCSAGCGRTGVICAIDYTWNLLKDGIVPENFNIYSLIQEMRTLRPAIVQTKEQYQLVQQAVTQLFEKHFELLSMSDPNQTMAILLHAK